MRNILISAFYGLPGRAFLPFLESLTDCGWSGRRVALCYDQDEDRDTLLMHYGFEVHRGTETLRPFVQRFHDALGVIGQDAGRVLLCDSRDVIFQRNPQMLPDDRVLWAAWEGLTIGSEHWQAGVASVAFPEEWEWLKDQPSFCAGTIFGRAPAIRELCGEIFRMCQETSHPTPDQPAYNIALGRRSMPGVLTEFAATLGVLGVEHFRGIRDVEAGDLGRFCLLHQWDRVPGLREELVARCCGPVEDERKEMTTDQFELVKPYSATLSELVTGKRVALVGPSPSMLGRGQGREIDGHDVVVRMNKAFPVPEADHQDIGMRTDLLYHCLCEVGNCGGPVRYADLSANGVAVAMPYPRKVAPFTADVHRFLRENARWGIPFHLMDIGLYRRVEAFTGTRPNTGVLAIADILAHRPAELSVYGFTFYRDGWQENYKVEPKYDHWVTTDFNGNHKQEPQIDLVRKLWRDSGGVMQPDDVMRAILNTQEQASRSDWPARPVRD